MSLTAPFRPRHRHGTAATAHPIPLAKPSRQAPPADAAKPARAHRSTHSADTPRRSGTGRRRHPAPTGSPVLLVGAGAHAAALTPVLRALPEAADVVVVLRMASREDRTHGAELAELTLRRGGRLIELSGARSAVALDAGRLRALVADIAHREVHVAGPAAFADAVLAGVRETATPDAARATHTRPAAA
ncbi:hypothetical protein DSM112329_04865 [Paraconexibacter sp. AEG42_29]|uniref:Uncharacterized protein n=1 Tax=Paraconexibacter sp. AEG42_29 TaxID=2997339 RepID=A0AAU7B275_9ACTN